MQTLNLGILAHVDAGKTTLTERLLYAAPIAHIGSVDDGTTQTDYLALERERGITIRSAVASFAIGNVAVNVLDTPGHPDFIAEVERVLSVLDAAILVVSAVEGVQPQTPLLMRALRRLNVPTMLFINKIDRAGADSARVVEQLRRRLALAPVPLGGVMHEGSREATYRPGEDDAWRSNVAVALAENDDALLRILVEDDRLPSDAVLHESLVAQTQRRLVQPVVFGSALMGVGVDAVMDAIETIMPAAVANADAPLSARVFKIERTPDGARSAYVRLFRGRIAVRDNVRYGDASHDRVTSLNVYQPGGARQAQAAAAGQIAALFGLRDVRIGDFIGERMADVPERQFPPPTLEAVVVPQQRADKARLRTALVELAEQDPFINVRQDDERGEISVSLYGDVQREVIEATLERDYGVRAAFRQTIVVHIERIASAASEERVIAAPTHSNISGRSSPDSTNPYAASLAATIEPAASGTGISVVLDVNIHLVPLYIYNTVDAFRVALTEYVRDALREGPNGWEVTDCSVTVWDSGYFRTGSTARDFRLLTTEIMHTLLRRAGTVVCEPYTRIDLELPAASGPGVGALLGQLGARVTGQFSTDEITRMSALMPTRILGEIKRRMPGASSGQGVLEEEFYGYEPVVGPAPVRRAL